MPDILARPDMTEIGVHGTPIWSGIITEEYNTNLRGTDGLAIYDKMRRSDGDVAAILAVLQLPIRATRWYIQPVSEAPQDKDIADWLHNALFEAMTITWDDFLRQALTMLDFGFSCFEKVYELRKADGKIGWRKLAPRLQTTKWQWELDETGGPAGMWQMAPPAYKKTFLPIDKLLLFVHRKEGGNLDGVAALRAAYKHFYYKDNLYRFEGISLERDAVGLPYVELPDNATPNDKAAARTLVTKLRRDEEAGLVYPQGWKVGLMSGRGQGELDYQKAIAHHSRMIKMSVLAQFLDLGSAETGSYALSEDQSSLLLYSLNAVAQHIADTINHYAVQQLLDYNWAGLKAYPKLAFSPVGQRDVVKIVDAITKLTQAMVLTPGPEIETYLRQELGLPALPETPPRPTTTARGSVEVEPPEEETSPVKEEAPEEAETGEEAKAADKAKSKASAFADWDDDTLFLALAKRLDMDVVLEGEQAKAMASVDDSITLEVLAQEVGRRFARRRAAFRLGGGQPSG